jgi:hypothetical protein
MELDRNAGRVHSAMSEYGRLSRRLERSNLTMFLQQAIAHKVDHDMDVPGERV